MNEVVNINTLIEKTNIVGNEQIPVSKSLYITLRQLRSFSSAYNFSAQVYQTSSGNSIAFNQGGNEVKQVIKIQSTITNATFQFGVTQLDGTENYLHLMFQGSIPTGQTVSLVLPSDYTSYGELIIPRPDSNNKIIEIAFVKTPSYLTTGGTAGKYIAVTHKELELNS